MININVISKEDKINEIGSFIEQDVSGIMNELNLDNIPLINITSYEGTQEEKYNQLKSVINILKNVDCVIITTAYLSTVEFSPTEYYFPVDDEVSSSKKAIPIKEVLERDSALLESIDFISINHYVRYETKVAYIYANDYGKKINDYMKKLNDLFNKK